MIRILFIEFLVSENAPLKSGATMRPTDSLSSYRVRCAMSVYVRPSPDDEETLRCMYCQILCDDNTLENGGFVIVGALESAQRC